MKNLVFKCSVSNLHTVKPGLKEVYSKEGCLKEVYFATQNIERCWIETCTWWNEPKICKSVISEFTKLKNKRCRNHMAISRMNCSTLLRNISFIMDLSSLRTDCPRTLKVKVLIHSTHLNKCFQPFII